MNRLHSALFAMGLLLLCGRVPAGMPIPENPSWQPEEDSVYLQETRRHVTTETPVTAVALFRNKLYAADRDGVSWLDDEGLRHVEGSPAAVARLKVLGGALWAASPQGLWRMDDQAWQQISNQPVADMCLHLGQFVVASAAHLYRVDGTSLVPITPVPPDPKRDLGKPPWLGVASYAGTLYVHSADRVAVVESNGLVHDDIADWGTLPSHAAIRDVSFKNNRLVFATDKGLAVLRGMTWYRIASEDGLCYEDTTCLAPGFAGDLWIGTKRGAIRHVGDEFQYFGCQHWLPHDHVNAIACGDNVVYIATDGGLGIIRYEPYTLQKKAAWYQRWLEEWGQKRLGFTHLLMWDDASGQWIREVSDNDVGYSTHFFAALCYKYAVTNDPAVRAEALDMMKSVKWSAEITGIDGFPARSIWAVGEKGHQAQHGSGGLPAEWHRTPDGQWEWKGDTSSDEVDAHVYAVSIFYELVANEEERKMAAEHLRHLVGHIVDNGWVLRDIDGKPTRWARWDPEYLQRPYGFYARGLNGMEAINYVTTAFHLTGDPKFKAGKEQLIAWGYPKEVIRQKLAFCPAEFTHFDDRLAFYTYFSLLRYEKDPALRSLWLRSLERSWEVKRIEGLPWFNYIYGVLTGNDCENSRAVAHLREWPLDCTMYSYTNSHRGDLHTPNGYRMYAERAKPLSPRETCAQRWDADFMRLDNDANGRVVSDPGSWLDAYWMGRYYGFIKPPTATDPDLLTVPKRGLQLGANPTPAPRVPDPERHRPQIQWTRQYLDWL